LDVVVHAEREAVRVAASGKLDFATVDQLRDAAEELIAAGFQSVVIDLRGLTLIDRAGRQLLDRLAASAHRVSCNLMLIPGPEAATCELTGLQPPRSADAHDQDAMPAVASIGATRQRPRLRPDKSLRDVRSAP
jgi:anti-anti-sigma factor